MMRLKELEALEKVTEKIGQLTVFGGHADLVTKDDKPVGVSSVAVYSYYYREMISHSTIDLEHDLASRAAGDRIACDTLVIWGERGIVHRLFDPVALWQAQCSAEVTPLLCTGAGHFIPEEQPEVTARALKRQFQAQRGR